MTVRLRFGIGLTERPSEGPDGTVPPTWTPLALPGLALWLAADGTGTLRDDPSGGGYTGPLRQAPDPQGTWFLSQWDDLSGHGRHATQPTAINQPEFVPNAVAGYPAIRFAGALTVLELPTLASLTQGEIFLVLRVDSDPPADAARSGLWSFGTAAGGTRYPDVDGIVHDGFGATDIKETVDPTASLAQVHIYNVSSQPDEWTSRLDGVELFSTDTNTVGFAAAPTLGRSAGERYLDGALHEAVLCDPLDAATRDQTLQYLAGKYGISLP